VFFDGNESLGSGWATRPGGCRFLVFDGGGRPRPYKSVFYQTNPMILDRIDAVVSLKEKLLRQLWPVFMVGFVLPKRSQIGQYQRWNMGSVGAFRV
jgi:hypothetical protein